MTGRTLRIDRDLCKGADCDRVCESIFPDFLMRAPLRINEWTMDEHGMNFEKVLNVVKYCPCKAVFLE